MYLSFFSHHQIVVVIFSNVVDANSPPEDTNTFPVENSPHNAYGKVAATMPAAFVAIELSDSEWTDGQFIIGDGTRSSSNPPLQTGFAYRAFIKSYLLSVCVLQFTCNVILNVIYNFCFIVE